MSSRQKYFSFPLLLLLMLALLNALQAYWICDDGYISFRFARNLALGHGLKFNLLPDPPVEGYTNLLWVLAAVPFEFFKIPSYLAIPYLSILTGLLLIWRVFRVAQYALGYSARMALFPALLLACFPPFLVWASSGLETMPFALFIFLVFEELILKPSTNFTLLALAGLALSTTRAEGPLWALTFAGLAFVFRADQRKVALKFALYILLVLGLHTAFRYYYYQELLPNTAAAKVAFSLERLQRGFNYIAVYLLTFITPLFALVAFFLRPRLSVFLLTLAFAGFFAYSVLSGGDYMSMGRFLVPSAAFQVLLLTVIVQQMARRSLAVASLLGVALLCIAYLPLQQIFIVPHSVRSAFHFRLNGNVFLDEYEHWQFMQENSRRWRMKGEMLAKISKPGDSLIEGTIGNTGYFSNLEIYDRLGLVNKLSGTFTKKKMGSPGHDVKAPISYFLPHNPTYIYANLDKPRALRNLDEFRAYYPYAPEITDSSYKGPGNQPYYFVILRRAGDQTEYEQLWQAATARSAEILRSTAP